MADTCCFYTTIGNQTPQLDTPVNVAASEVTGVSAKITWDAVDDATSYVVRYTPGGVEQTVTGTTADLTGLTQGTAYTVTVVAVAEGFKNSNPGTTGFTTESVPALGPVQNFQTMLVEGTTAYLSWDLLENAESYTITLSPADAGPFTGIIDPGKEITGLTVSTEYTATIVAVAEGYADSPPVTTQFTTEDLPALGRLQNMQASVITKTTANITWDPLENADTYTLTLDPPDVGPFTDIINPGEELTGLTPGTQYTATGIGVAPGFVDSEPSTVQFTTEAA